MSRLRRVSTNNYEHSDVVRRWWTKRRYAKAAAGITKYEQDVNHRDRGIVPRCCLGDHGCGLKQDDDKCQDSGKQYDDRTDIRTLASAESSVVALLHNYKATASCRSQFKAAVAQQNTDVAKVNADLSPAVKSAVLFSGSGSSMEST